MHCLCSAERTAANAEPRVVSGSGRELLAAAISGDAAAWDAASTGGNTRGLKQKSKSAVETDLRCEDINNNSESFRHKTTNSHQVSNNRKGNRSDMNIRQVVAEDDDAERTLRYIWLVLLHRGSRWGTSEQWNGALCKLTPWRVVRST